MNYQTITIHFSIQNISKILKKNGWKGILGNKIK